MTRDGDGPARRPLPRKTRLADLSEKAFTQIIQLYNNTPRKRLGNRTPAETLYDQVLHLECELNVRYARGRPFVSLTRGAEGEVNVQGVESCIHWGDSRGWRMTALGLWGFRPMRGLAQSWLARIFGVLAAVALALLLGLAQLDTAQARQGAEDTVLAGAMQASSPCENGVVIPDLSIRPELAADCEVLWRVRSALGGESLDWSGAAGIGEWEGVGLSLVDESLSRNTSGTLRVSEVNLVSAGLTGGIPPALGELSALWRLDLSDNDLQGSIPPELGKLSALDYLGLADNQLTGTIPAAFGKLSKLQRMDISNNRLSGDVPVEFCNLPSLVYVEVEGNGNPLEFRESCLNVSIPRVEGPGILQVEENHRGALATYNATDEQGHNVSWSLERQNEEDWERFTLDSEGVLRFRAPPDFENPVDHDGDNEYSILIVPTDDGTPNLSMGFGVRVTVVDVLDETIMAGADTASVGEGSDVRINTSTLLSNDVHAEGAGLSVVSVQDAVNGTVTLSGYTITYRHDGSETVSGSFTYTASDGTRGATAVVNIAVRPWNAPPMAMDDRSRITPGGRLVVPASALLSNDTDVEDEPLTIIEVRNADNGTVTLDGETVIYQHDGSLTSTGGFNYIVSDGSNTSSARVRITIVWAEDATGLFSIGDLVIDTELLVFFIMLVVGGPVLVGALFFVLRATRGATRRPPPAEG